jgi:pimeloyl-ACP methyl ester carboxylesterase
MASVNYRRSTKAIRLTKESLGDILELATKDFYDSDEYLATTEINAMYGDATVTAETIPDLLAEFGRLGGTVYQIEMPDDWNGKLLLYMHGFGELRPEAGVSPPAIRTYLILHGFAWGASSFSSTWLIPGRAADETAALWDHFARKYRRPERTYVTGGSMGGGASHIAAERYADRFDGALSLCGSAGQTAGVEVTADFFAAAAYIAGVTQAEFDAGNVARLIRQRIRPALADATAHQRFESIMLDLTGGPRAFDREGFRLEEDTNWSRAQLLVSARLAPNADRVYRLGPLSDVTSEEFNRAAVRLPVNDDLLRAFVAGNEMTGDLQVPLMALHTTGDWQVPLNQEQVRRRKVESAGKSNLLVQRVVRDPGHCGFTSAEWEDALKALVAWVERAEKPEGEDVLTDDLRTLGEKFTLMPRHGSPEADAVPGAADRITLRGTLTLDGVPFSAGFLGAVVHRDGLTAACQYSLAQVVAGQYELTVMADAEARGCGTPGAEILLWMSARSPILYSSGTLRWPADGTTTTFNAKFSASAPDGASTPVTEFFGEVFGRDGEHLLGGTVVEAYVGDVLCGVGSVRRVGSFAGYILAVAGPASVPGCAEGPMLTFRIDGQPASQTARNDLGRGQNENPLDLVVK